MSFAVPLTATVNSFCPLSPLMNAQGVFSSVDTSMLYAPSSFLYTSKLAEGQGKNPILLPCHDGVMSLSTVSVNNMSPPSSVMKGLRLGRMARMSLSTVLILKRCPATLNILLFMFVCVVVIVCVWAVDRNLLVAPFAKIRTNKREILMLLQYFSRFA